MKGEIILSKIKVLVVEPERKPYVKVIEHTLENLQSIVGGHIEAVYDVTNENVAYVVNEEGKINGSQFNRALYFDGTLVDYIFGTFFICGVGVDDFIDISDEDITSYSNLYQHKEYLFCSRGKIKHIICK